MKIYTKTGDAGDTGLFGGGRVSKANARVDTYGEIDELNSVIGFVRCGCDAKLADVDAELARIQSELFDLGAELATSPERQSKLGALRIDEEAIAALEHAIDRADGELAPLTTFVLPGGGEAAARFHLARTVCRRAERRLVALAAAEPVRGELVRYVNRLSDLLFTWARVANRRAGVEDVPWQGRARMAP